VVLTAVVTLVAVVERFSVEEQPPTPISNTRRPSALATTLFVRPVRPYDPIAALRSRLNHALGLPGRSTGRRMNDFLLPVTDLSM